MSESSYSWGKTLKPAETTIEVEKGFNYTVKPDKSKESERKSFVKIIKTKQ